jgi:AraC-like DNA-binding protein
MPYASRRPAPPLDAIIETLWTSERAAPAAHAREWNLPTGHANRVGDVQRASGCSPARFIERYRAACGLAPKRHAALMRFNALLQVAGGVAACAPPAWAAAASDVGYADQAHMNREFRRFTGLAPGEYRRAATAFANHVACV